MKRYRIGVLLYFRSEDGRLLLIRRKKAPNRDLWCAVGGKLEMELGESPAECARREAEEEVGLTVDDTELSLRCMLSEVDYEGTGHWLMFVYEIGKRLAELPSDIDEGEFAFFATEELAALDMPALDRHVLLELVLGGKRNAFFAIYAGKGVEKDPGRIVVEETIGGGPGRK